VGTRLITIYYQGHAQTLDMVRGVASGHFDTELSDYGRHRAGIDFDAIDGRPVHHFFLIVAPPVEVSGQYLPVLGKLAQFAKNRDVPARLANLSSANEFLDLLESRSA